jgi:hypothetical protein
MQAIIEIFLDIGRVEHRHQQRLEKVLGLVRQGRGFGRMVVAGNDQHAAMLREPAALAWRKTSPQRSTPGPLPYHRPNTPSYLAPGNRPTCWLPQTVVAAMSSLMPGWKVMWCSARCALAFHRPRIEIAERAAAVAGNEAGGIQPGGKVALALQHRQADQRLGTGQKDAAGCGGVFVVQRAAEPASAMAQTLAHCCLRSALFTPCPKRFRHKSTYFQR